jgi:hypothetical protein
MNPISLIQNYRKKYSIMNVPRNLVMEISRFNMKRKITDEELSLVLDKRIENLKEECAMWKEKNAVLEREIELSKAEERIAKYEKETLPGNWQPSKYNGKTMKEIEEEPEVKTISYTPCISTPGNESCVDTCYCVIPSPEEEPEVGLYESYTPCVSCSIESCTCFTNWKTGKEFYFDSAKNSYMPCECPKAEHLNCLKGPSPEEEPKVVVNPETNAYNKAYKTKWNRVAKAWGKKRQTGSGTPHTPCKSDTCWCNSLKGKELEKAYQAYENKCSLGYSFNNLDKIIHNKNCSCYVAAQFYRKLVDEKLPSYKNIDQGYEYGKYNGKTIVL